ncbi:hypothetical protein L210DRAFT_3630098 [Boletus edulis BED1]|uniref:ABC transporter domain-containing protein n=1 Tax=Boletus edulis BED1 TaxID=1328754 RepID=A0AAD4BWX8_BOLED|nr:hypothetical protein L210DRAFT_3630098 [Boletus edulis BED1]
MTTRRALLVRIAAASLPAAGASPFASALFDLRVASPAVVFLATLSLLPSKPLSPPSPSPITPVVVQSRVPRRSLILSLLSLAALSFLVDGLAYVVYAVLNGVWTPGTGVELAALLGLIAYAALAALGAYKDVNSIEIWSHKRVKIAILAALALDIAQVVLLALSVKRDPKHICDTSKLSECIPQYLHFFTPLLRIFFLLPLFSVLFSPRVVYHPADSQPEMAEAESAPLVGQSDVEGNEAVSGGESSKYGTFTARGQPERTTAAVPPQSDTSLAILFRLSPYVISAKGLIWIITLLHVLTRVIIPLLPLSLGAAVNAFLSSSSAPIPTPLGTSPYTYIFVFVLLHFLASEGGIPNFTKALVSRLGADAEGVLSSHYTDHVLGLTLGSSNAKISEDLHATASGAITKVLHALSVAAATIDDALIGAVVLSVLFGWEFGLAVLIALGIYGYVICLTCRSSVPTACPAMVSAFVQALLASGALLLGSLYIAKGVTEGIWSAGAWVTWVWYWGIIFLPLTWTPSLSAATSDVRSIFKILDKPAGVVHGKGTIDGTGGIEVKFDNVHITYPYTDTQEPVPALTGVSFVVPASSVTAIVSTPGSTKSSVLKALYRLYDVDTGSIAFNGIPIHSLSLASLHSLVAAVPDVCSDDRAKALSHALVKDAKVILLEGPLERTLIGGRTVVWEVGTSGLDGVDSVDQILVLKDGQLVESGPFKELVQADGPFASLWADHIGAGAPVPGSSSATASGVAEGYDISTNNTQPIDSQIGEGSVVEAFILDSPRAVTASIRAASVRAPTASIRAPSIKPTVSIKADSVAPPVPIKDLASAAPKESAPVAFPTPNVFSGSSAPGPIAFPKADDSRSFDSGSQTHVRLPTSITFDTTATPPRVSTPDPTGASSSPPETEGKRKRISSQNFQRLARRISLSTPKKGVGIQGIPGIANIAGVLRRDTSVKSSDKGSGENGARESTDVTGGSSSAPETARNSGEINAERTEKDKEREEKKRKRKSFMEVVGARWGDSGAVATPPSTDTEPQNPSASAGEA